MSKDKAIGWATLGVVVGYVVAYKLYQVAFRTAWGTQAYKWTYTRYGR